MIPFKSPELSDREAAAKAVAASGYIGSDACFTNVYLLRKKYGTQVALQDGFLFRYYNGQGSRRGYAFPLGEGDVAGALKWIVDDAQATGRPLEFCLVDELRAQILQEYFNANAGSNGAESPLHFENNRGDSDYVYSAEALATLAGNQYRKKRNHISRFNRTYGQFELQEIKAENAGVALEIEKLWLKSVAGDSACEPTCECEEAARAECSEDELSRMAEYCAIVEALENFDALQMRGAVHGTAISRKSLGNMRTTAGMPSSTRCLPNAWWPTVQNSSTAKKTSGSKASARQNFRTTRRRFLTKPTLRVIPATLRVIPAKAGIS